MQPFRKTQWLCLVLFLTSVGLLVAASEAKSLRGLIFCICGSLQCFATVIWLTVQEAMNAKMGQAIPS